MTRAPLRFLLTVLVLWAGARAAILLPDWRGGTGPVPTATAAPRAPAGIARSPAPVPTTALPVSPSAPLAREGAKPASSRRTASPLIALARVSPATLPAGSRDGRPDARPSTWPSFPPLPPFRLHPAPAASRWQVSAWLLVRDEGGAALAPGGTLGGSQAGGRITYALGGGLALSGRFYLPLRPTAGAELAAGIDWRPVPSLPVNLLAERRQRLGRDGRSAFALTVYGGTSRALTPRTRLDVYAQAGMVGLHARDPFVDGSARLSRRIGPVEVGAGAWGAAQPGAARLDAGPSLSWRLPVRDTNLRLQADWRFRVTGDAAPRSGPALTLAVDF